MAPIVEGTMWPLRAPLTEPIRVSFGEMRSRPGFLLSLKDEHGVQGWGESWINFPEWAPYERTMILAHLLRDVVGRDFRARDIPDLFYKYLPQVMQWGGIGPYSQAMSAIECALWDLEAKREGVPLFVLLGRESEVVHVPVYGSGIGPSHLERRVTSALEAGFLDVKIKVGFDAHEDRQRFKTAMRLVDEGRVMVDANQAWDRHTADRESHFYSHRGALWIEEPISSLDIEGYRLLTSKYGCLAAGENWYIPTIPSVSSLSLGVFQPDLCKISGLWAAERMIEQGPKLTVGLAFHVLGLPISHSFALHVAAARVQYAARVEVDTNENPLAQMLPLPWKFERGMASWTKGAGLGVEVDEERLESFVIPELHAFRTVTAEFDTNRR